MASASSKARTAPTAVDKAMMILQAMSGFDREMELAEIASRVDLPKSTVLRQLQAMRRHHIVQQDPRTRRYRLGTSMIRMGKAAERQFDLESLVEPYLRDLVKATGETASFAVLEGHQAVYLAQVLSGSIIRGVPPIGTVLGLHCTAIGKILLASFSDEKIDDMIGSYGLPRYTEKTIVNAEQLRKELDRTRKQGFALDDEEAEPGGRCIASAICDEAGDIIGAVSITGPTTRIPMDQIPNFANAVKRSAERISRALQEKGNLDD